MRTNKKMYVQTASRAFYQCEASCMSGEHIRAALHGGWPSRLSGISCPPKCKHCSRVTARAKSVNVQKGSLSPISATVCVVVHEKWSSRG